MLKQDLKTIDKCKNLANSIAVNNNKEGEEASDSSDEEDSACDSDNEELSDDNVVLKILEESKKLEILAVRMKKKVKKTIKTLRETADFSSYKNRKTNDHIHDKTIFLEIWTDIN